MSHLSVLVALDGVANVNGNLEQLVRHQLAPFNEYNEAFYDGPLLDRWVVGQFGPERD